MWCVVLISGHLTEILTVFVSFSFRYLVFAILAAVSVIANAPTQSERNDILEYHTEKRAGVQPTASNMRLMVRRLI